MALKGGGGKSTVTPQILIRSKQRKGDFSFSQYIRHCLNNSIASHISNREPFR